MAQPQHNPFKLALEAALDKLRASDTAALRALASESADGTSWVCHVCGNPNHLSRRHCFMQVCAAPRGFPGPYTSAVRPLPPPVDPATKIKHEEDAAARVGPIAKQPKITPPRTTAKGGRSSTMAKMTGAKCQLNRAPVTQPFYAAPSATAYYAAPPMQMHTMLPYNTIDDSSNQYLLAPQMVSSGGPTYPSLHAPQLQPLMPCQPPVLICNMPSSAHVPYQSMMYPLPFVHRQI